ncbi:hypothetical protein HK100_008255 [Physocladia obscura]|uniref:Uncharacterized protein n=1 Tax=Physocladia obscura TaxID=109957 RepID=A0AAD5TAX6_9FUNG|nr:hypothetical protein HK100_008255 [Physocladia obscura]
MGDIKATKSKTPPPLVRVAIVGSGLAGMTAAHVLAQTTGIRVTLIERNPGIGMDAGSIPVPCDCQACNSETDIDAGADTKTHRNSLDSTSNIQSRFSSRTHISTRIDVPMRSFSPGYYPYLTSLYDSLRIPYKQSDDSTSFFTLTNSADPQTVFASPASFPTKLEITTGKTAQFAEIKNRGLASYFTFSCVRLPGFDSIFRIPDLPPLQNVVHYFSELKVRYLILRDYSALRRFAVECMKTGTIQQAKEGHGHLANKTFGDCMHSFGYSNEFWSTFLAFFSIMCTCTFEDVKAYPAYVILEFCAVTNSNGKMCFVTCSIKDVCDRLVEPVQTIQNSTTVCGIRHNEQTSKFIITTVPTSEAHLPQCEQTNTWHEYDHVIFATQANQASRILQSTATENVKNDNLYTNFISRAVQVLNQFPYTKSLVVCHTDTALMPASRSEWRCLNFGVLEKHTKNPYSPVSKQSHAEGYIVDDLAMCTHYSQMTTAVPDGVPPLFQTTNPVMLPAANSIISATWYERAVVRAGTATALRNLKLLQGGGGGVWFVGSYICDGIPLLEGCVTSAVAAARAIVEKEFGKDREIFMPEGMAEKVRIYETMVKGSVPGNEGKNINWSWMNIALVIGINQIATKFELERPEFVPYIRAAYFTVQALTLAIAFYIRTKINNKNADKTPLVYTEAKSIFDPKNLETVTTNVTDYDITKSNEALQQTALGVLMMCVMHFKFGYIRPLLLQAILGLKNVAGTQLFEIYILGKPATGALQRPWKKNAFEAAPTAATPKEAKAIEKKEAKKKLNKSE